LTKLLRLELEFGTWDSFCGRGEESDFDDPAGEMGRSSNFSSSIMANKQEFSRALPQLRGNFSTVGEQEAISKLLVHVIYTALLSTSSTYQKFSLCQKGTRSRRMKGPLITRYNFHQAVGDSGMPAGNVGPTQISVAISDLFPPVNFIELVYVVL
jgi:hypothetical protein